MALTAAQQTILRNDVLLDATLNTLPHNTDSAFEIARVYNLPASVATPVWNSTTDVAAIFDAIDWTKYTPADAPDNTATYSNRMLNIQTKQMNLQNMLLGRATINAAKANIRAGLRDAVTQLPAGVAGALTTAGGANGVNVLNQCVRPTNATRAEKLLSSGPSTTGTVTADVLTFEGSLSYPDVMTAMGW